MAKREYPPKFAIANGFVIGSFPQRIKFLQKTVKNKLGKSMTMIYQIWSKPSWPQFDRMEVYFHILEARRNQYEVTINFLRWIKTDLEEL